MSMPTTEFLISRLSPNGYTWCILLPDNPIHIHRFPQFQLAFVYLVPYIQKVTQPRAHYIKSKSLHVLTELGRGAYRLHVSSCYINIFR
jgi:hypothetical protein